MDSLLSPKFRAALGIFAVLWLGMGAALIAGQHLQGSEQSLTASTALGYAQHVPPGYFDTTGAPSDNTGPDQARCYINQSPEYGCGNVSCQSICRDQSKPYNFYTEIFSVDLGGGQGQTRYTTSTYAPGAYVKDKFAGQARSYPPVVSDNQNVSYICGDYQTYTQDNSIGYSQDPDSGAYLYTPYPVPAGDSYVAVDSGSGGGMLSSGGIFSGGGGDGNCYGYKYIPQSLVTGDPISAGDTAITVAPNTPLTLEWSCLPSRTVHEEFKSGQNLLSEGEWSDVILYGVNVATGASGSGPGFNMPGGPLTNKRNITAPAQANTYTYTLKCDGPWSLPTMSINVTVKDGGNPQLPSVTLTGNGKSDSVNVKPGQTVHLVATFSPAGSYIGSAIDNFDSSRALTSEDASSPKTYDFNTPGNPATEGPYLFNANVRTSLLGWANNFGKSFTVNVSPAQCTDDGTRTCSGNTVVNNCNTTIKVCSGATPICSGGSCVAVLSCGNGLDYALYGPSCSCPSNQHQAGSSCVPDSGNIIQGLLADPIRVHKGTTTMLSWATEGMASCTLAQNGVVFNNNAPLSSNSFTSPAVNTSSTFTLSCTDGIDTYTSQALVNILPSFIEI